MLCSSIDAHKLCTVIALEIRVKNISCSYSYFAVIILRNVIKLKGYVIAVYLSYVKFDKFIACNKSILLAEASYNGARNLNPYKVRYYI